MKDPEKGYTPRLLDRMGAVLPGCLRNGTNESEGKGLSRTRVRESVSDHGAWCVPPTFAVRPFVRLLYTIVRNWSVVMKPFPHVAS